METKNERDQKKYHWQPCDQLQMCAALPSQAAANATIFVAVSNPVCCFCVNRPSVRRFVSEGVLLLKEGATLGQYQIKVR